MNIRFIHYSKLSSKQQAGFLKTEALLALVLLVSAMTFANTMIYRINLLWEDSHRQQFAMQELSNQLAILSSTPASQLTTEIESLQLSEDCLDVLPDAKLSGLISNDDLGTRITLQMIWGKQRQHQPLELSAWHAAASGSSEKESAP